MAGRAFYTDIYQPMAGYGNADSPFLKAEPRRLGCSMAFYTDSRVEPTRCGTSSATAQTLIYASARDRL